MPHQISINHVTNYSNQLGAGPLSTVVYEGVYGVSTSLFGAVFMKKFKEKPRRVLVKKINSKIVSEKVDWEILRSLEHPNVASYIYICERSNFFFSSTFIIQDFCEHTLEHFVPQLGFNRVVNIPVFKNAVKEIVTGLHYLHSRSIVHRNLKPSNILVKPPLADPSRFILTDFWYTDNTRHVPEHNFWCFRYRKPLSDDHDVLKWMAPELVANCGTTATTMMDMFSFGMILKFMITHGPLCVDYADGILLELLIQESLSQNPFRRITSGDLLESHPFLLDVSLRGVAEIADSRLNYIKNAYDEIVKLEAHSGSGSFRKRIESKVRCVAGESMFPWNRLFKKRVLKELIGQPDHRYNPHSFIDLLKLVSDYKEHLPTGSASDAIRRQVADDAFSRYFPYTIPLVYLCLSCRDMTFLPSLALLENEEKKRRQKFRCT